MLLKVIPGGTHSRLISVTSSSNQSQIIGVKVGIAVKNRNFSFVMGICDFQYPKVLLLLKITI